MKIVSTDFAPKAIGPYSQAVVCNGLIYTSGQIPLTKEGELVCGGIYDQTRQVLENLGAVLRSENASFEDVIKTTVFLSDMENFSEFNKVYEEFFSTHKPARSTVAVKTLPRNVLVEIECIAKLR